MSQNNDLIRRSDLKAAVDDICYSCGRETEVEGGVLIDLVEQLPAVDAEVVRHGCDWCNGAYHTELSAHAVRHHTSENTSVYVLDVNYCPNCGAKMRGDVNAAD